MNNAINLPMLRKVNTTAQSDSVYKLSIAKHNGDVEEKKQNRNVCCPKHKCGKFELPHGRHDETLSSKDPGIFWGLTDFVCGLDSSLDAHIRNATIFKGT